MIVTNEFKLTPEKCFTISLKQTLSRVWLWLTLIFIFFSGMFAKMFYLSLFPFIFLPFFVIFVFQTVHSKKNKIFFKERHCAINEEFLTTCFSDGSESKLKLTNIIKIQKKNDCYLLYIAKAAFVYMPFSCFKSDSDLKEFDRIITSKVSAPSR